MAPRGFHELMRQSKRELEEKGSTTTTTFEMLEQNNYASIEDLALLRASLACEQGFQELMEDPTFQQLAKLKSVAELICYEEPKKPEKKKPLKDEGSKEVADEESRRHELFGDFNTNEMILATIDVLECGTLIANKPEPIFFDALLYVLGRYPHLSKSVQKVEVVLDQPTKDFEDNLFHMPTVLALLIRESQLQSLTLQKFDPQTVVAVVTSSLHKQEALEVLDLQHNSLTTRDVLVALRGLPATGKEQLVINLNHNRVKDEERVRDFLSYRPNLVVKMDHQNARAGP